MSSFDAAGFKITPLNQQKVAFTPKARAISPSSPFLTSTGRLGTNNGTCDGIIGRDGAKHYLQLPQTSGHSPSIDQGESFELFVQRYRTFEQDSAAVQP